MANALSVEQNSAMATLQGESGTSTDGYEPKRVPGSRAVVPLSRATAAISATLAVAASIVLVATGNLRSWWSEDGATEAVFSLFFTVFVVLVAVFVWLVVPQQPRNPVVWTMAASAFFGGVYVAGLVSASLVVDDPNSVLISTETVVPAELPAAAWILMFSEPALILAWFPLLTFGLLLFPDGRSPSSRWRGVGVLAVVGITVSTLAFMWGFRPGSTSPADESLLLDLGLVAASIAIILSLVALIDRFRRSRGPAREPFKWIVWGAAFFAPAMVIAVALGGTRYEELGLAPLMVGGAVFIASYAIAVGRHRLFDVNVVISRTVVVAGLAGFITVVYAVIVGGAGLLLGLGTGAALPLSIAATVVVAIAFQPVRERMQHWANRLVFGSRATPYEVLSRFSDRMRETVATEDLISQMARLLTQGTGAKQTVVWMTTGDELRPVANWPAETPLPAPMMTGPGGSPSSDVDYVALVEHNDELLGAVAMIMPRGETLTPSAERLVDDVASQAGLVLRNARLSADLVDTIRELRSSRQRLVAAQDDERRRLERDLHDGAQQQLVALKIKLGVVRRATDGAKRDEMLETLMDDTDEAIQTLRNLAHGIYPPLLEAEGLVAALNARTRNAPIPISVTAPDLERYSAEVEAAVYFSVLESIQNAAKYAAASRIDVTLRHQQDYLEFVVTDDGSGFDPSARARGRGLINITDRLDALGGSLEVRSAPGEGTTVIGNVRVERAKDNRAGSHAEGQEIRRTRHPTGVE